jgi:hypothetical protein
MKAVNESSPEVGSSRSIEAGLPINSIAMEHLFLSPPDIPFTNYPPI